MRVKPYFPAFYLLIAGLFTLLLIPVSQVLADEQRRTITLTSSGTVKARPDTAHISTGVVSDADTARKALDSNTAAMERIITALKSQGLAPEEIQTTNFSVNPRYERNKDRRTPKVIGYRVTNSVRIQVRDLNKLGEILDKVVSLGSNKVNGIQFSIRNSNELLDKARMKAMEKVIARAKLYAKAASVQLGKIISIQEASYHPQPRQFSSRVAYEAKARPVPIEAGSQTLRANVTVTWELD